MSLNMTHGCWLSLTVSQVPWGSYMSSSISYYCSFTLTVFPTSIELLRVSHCLLWLLTVLNCLS